MKPRPRMAMALPGLILALMPACMQTPPPAALRQLAPNPPPNVNVQRDSYPMVSPYGAIADTTQPPPRATAKRPRRPQPPPEDVDEASVSLPGPVREPEIDGIGPPLKLIGSPVPVPPPPEPQPPPHTMLPAATDPALIQAMRTYIDKRPDLAYEMLKQFPAENQDALLVLLPLTVRMSEESLRETNPQEMAAMLDQLQQLMQLLQPMATLVLDKICFCRQIHGFGNYEPLGDHPTFHAGELVELYAEIRNLSCEQVSSRKNSYRTHVISRLEIRDATGSFFWKPQKREKDDYNQTPQHDYFHHYRFALPDMPPGEYSLFLEVTDVPTERKVKRKLDFHVNR